MSTPLEHDYIGLSESSSVKISSSSSSSSSPDDDDGQKKQNILKETQLSLGLPGFGKDSLHMKNSFVSGAKRGFSDAIHVSHKWGFDFSKSEPDLSQASASVLFSPKSGLESNNSQKSSLPTSTKPVVEDKKISGSAPAAKAQVVGWPPIRSFRKNTMATNLSKNSDGIADGSNSGSGGCLYVKVSMDGAPFLRKVDLKTYSNYAEFSSALEKMFSCFTLGHFTSDHGLPGREGLSESRLKDLIHGSECVLTYEDKDGDWMLAGDVPWEMFTESCKRLRIMKGSEAIGLAPRTMEKRKNGN